MDSWDRNISDVPAVVVGPAARACGGCHRAELINEDLAGELTMLNLHMTQGGYLISTDREEAPGLLLNVIDQMMDLFK